MTSDITNNLRDEFVHDGIIFGKITNRGVLEEIKDYPLTKDDIVISTYPKSGTRWLQEMTWLVMNDGKPSSIDLNLRVPFMEHEMPERKSLDLLTAGPNVVKTHLPHQYFTKAINVNKTKMIVLMRNIRDLLVSYYHFYRMNATLGNFSGTWNDFFELFKSKRLQYGDYLDFNLGWWSKRNLENVLILFYEDIKENPEREIRRLTQFCEKSYPDDVISAIAGLTTFNAMKENSAVNLAKSIALDHSISPFMRKGEVGVWQNYFTSDQLSYLEENYEPKLKIAGLKFRYELFN